MSKLRNSFRRQLQLEQLDKRDLLAGDCVATLDGGDLTVRCDHENNFVAVSEHFLTGDLLVEGRDDTAINGIVNGTVNFGQVALDDLQIRTRGGDDTVLVSSLAADDVDIRTGSGNDDVLVSFITAEEVRVRTGSGDDNIGTLVIVADEIELRGGAGNDVVSLSNLTAAEEVKARGGSGLDTLLILSPVIGELDERGFEIISNSPGLPGPPPPSI